MLSNRLFTETLDECCVMWNTEEMTQIHAPKHTHARTHTAVPSSERHGDSTTFHRRRWTRTQPWLPGPHQLAAAALRLVTGLTAPQRLLQFSRRHCFHWKRIHPVPEAEKTPQR